MTLSICVRYAEQREFFFFIELRRVAAVFAFIPTPMCLYIYDNVIYDNVLCVTALNFPNLFFFFLFGCKLLTATLYIYYDGVRIESQ